MNYHDLEIGARVMCDRPYHRRKRMLCVIESFGRDPRGVRFVTVREIWNGQPARPRFTCAPTRLTLATGDEIDTGNVCEVA